MRGSVETVCVAPETAKRQSRPQTNSLTSLAAKLGMSKTAVQRDHELYLLSKDFIEIDGKRRITAKGRELLSQTQSQTQP